MEISAYEADNRNRGGLPCMAHGCGDLDCLRCIAIHTQRVEADVDVAAVEISHYPFGDDAHGTRRNLGDVVQNGSTQLGRYQRVVGVVRAIDECFRDGAQPADAARRSTAAEARPMRGRAPHPTTPATTAAACASCDTIALYRAP